jgi:hypothetical protein
MSFAEEDCCGTVGREAFQVGRPKSHATRADAGSGKYREGPEVALRRQRAFPVRRNRRERSSDQGPLTTVVPAIPEHWTPLAEQPGDDDEPTPRWSAEAGVPVSCGSRDQSTEKVGSSGGSARGRTMRGALRSSVMPLKTLALPRRGPNKSAWGRATRHEPRATPQVVNQERRKP